MSSTMVAPVAAAAAVTDAVAALVDSLTGAAVRDLGHDQLRELVRTARAATSRLGWVTLEAAGEVDARGSHTSEGALTAGAWLRMHTAATPAEAAAAVRTARVLRSGVLPATRDALAAGAISPAHAQVIATAVTDAPAPAVALIEPEALAVARAGDVRATSAVMRAFAHALDPDAADAAALRRYQRAGITLSPTLDGSMHISGLADEVTGALLATAIDAAGPLIPGDTRTPARRRLDALADIAGAYLAHPDTPTTGHGAHPHLIVTTDHTTLRQDPTTDPAPTDHSSSANGANGANNADSADSTSESGSAGSAGSAGPGGTLSWVGRITASTARRVGCDAMATFVTLGPDGEVQEAGTQRRFFTNPQRRAMIARDGDRCAAPYCDRPITWSHAHHLTPVEHGGPTTVANGALPCEGHHVLLHEGRWRLERLPDGRYLLRHTSTDRIIGPEPHPPGHNRPPPHTRE